MQTTLKKEYKGSPVYIKKLNANWEINPHRCFCCREQIKKGEVLLLMNMYRYIPNILIHEECFKKWEGNTNSLFSDIEDSWKKYKALKEVFN